MVVAAVDQRRRGAVVELQKRRAARLGRPRRIEHGGAGAHAAHESAGEQPRGVDLVRHLVEQDAAALRGVELLRPARAVEIVRVVEAVNEPELAQLAAHDDLAHQPHRRIEGMGVADDQMHLVPLDGRDDGVAIVERQRHRLFQDDVLAVLGGEDGVRRVELVRRGDIDHLDRRVARPASARPHRPARCGRGRTPRAARGCGSAAALSTKSGWSAAAWTITAPAMPRPAIPKPDRLAAPLGSLHDPVVAGIS